MRQILNFSALALGILTFLIFLNCDDTTELKSSQIFDPAVHGELAKDTLYAELDTTFSIPVPVTQASTRLLVGSFSAITCTPIIKFTSLPANASISEAHIKFITAGISGANPQPFDTFTVKANPILNDWTTNKDMINFDLTTELGSMAITADSSDTLIMQMNSTGLDFLNRWADTDSSALNYGFVLNFSNANFIKAFYSNRSTAGPRVVLSYTLPGDTTARKDSVLATADGFLVDGDITIAADRDYASTLNPWVTLLQFNTSPLLKEHPEGIIIESANLQLSIDKSNTLFNADFGALLRAVRLKSDLNDNVVEVDSSVISSPTYSIDVTQLIDDSSMVVTRPGTERRDLGRVYLQDLVESPTPTKKLYIGFQTNIEFLSYIAFFKRDDPDKNKRPQIIVEYWIPPERRF